MTETSPAAAAPSYAGPSPTIEAPDRGVTAIAARINESERRTQYLLETGQLPAYKMGRLWHMRPSAYVALIEAKERAAMARVMAKVAA